jgi:hypothetical protein
MKPLENVGMGEFAIKPSKYVRQFEDAGGGLLSRHNEIVGIYIPVTGWGLLNSLKVWEFYLNAFSDNELKNLPPEQQRAIEVFRKFLAANHTEVQRIRQQFFTDDAKREFPYETEAVSQATDADDDWEETSTDPEK